ncbi:MAG: hypothetical protein LBE95_00555 [Holosporaceae bacterium]|jgi:predicted metal-binding protein|nr:hypothetical protein [Holosporaceae bacterium]
MYIYIAKIVVQMRYARVFLCKVCGTNFTDGRRRKKHSSMVIRLEQITAICIN